MLYYTEIFRTNLLSKKVFNNHVTQFNEQILNTQFEIYDLLENN